jgi:hypothetical protein
MSLPSRLSGFALAEGPRGKRAEPLVLQKVKFRSAKAVCVAFELAIGCRK